MAKAATPSVKVTLVDVFESFRGKYEKIKGKGYLTKHPKVASHILERIFRSLKSNPEKDLALLNNADRLKEEYTKAAKEYAKAAKVPYVPYDKLYNSFNPKTQREIPGAQQIEPGQMDHQQDPMPEHDLLDISLGH